MKINKLMVITLALLVSISQYCVSKKLLLKRHNLATFDISQLTNLSDLSFNLGCFKNSVYNKLKDYFFLLTSQESHDKLFGFILQANEEPNGAESIEEKKKNLTKAVEDLKELIFSHLVKWHDNKSKKECESFKITEEVDTQLNMLILTEFNIKHEDLNQLLNPQNLVCPKEKSFDLKDLVNIAFKIDYRLFSDIASMYTIIQKKNGKIDYKMFVFHLLSLVSRLARTCSKIKKNN